MVRSEHSHDLLVEDDIKVTASNILHLCKASRLMETRSHSISLFDQGLYDMKTRWSMVLSNGY